MIITQSRVTSWYVLHLHQHHPSHVFGVKLRVSSPFLIKSKPCLKTPEKQGEAQLPDVPLEAHREQGGWIAWSEIVNIRKVSDLYL